MKILFLFRLMGGVSGLTIHCFVVTTSFIFNISNDPFSALLNRAQSSSFVRNLQGDRGFPGAIGPQGPKGPVVSSLEHLQRSVNVCATTIQLSFAATHNTM